MKNRVHICHHNDLDGYAAAYVAWRACKWYKLIPSELISFHEITYGKEFPFSEIRNEDVVIIVDYSLPVNDMQKLLDITPCVIWIDHHKTAMEMYDNDGYSSPYQLRPGFDVRTLDDIENEIYSPCGFNEEYIKPYEISFKPVREGNVIPGLRSSRFCGAVNTWVFFEIMVRVMYENKQGIPYIDNDVRNCFIFPVIKEDPIEFNVDDIYVPHLLKLVNDWDLWILEFADSENLNTFFGAHKSTMSPASNTWHELWSDTGYLSHALNEGFIMLQYKRGVSSRTAKSGAFKAEIDGVPVIALNTTEASSKAFDSVKDDPKFADCKAMLRFCLNSDHKWEYSMYSEEIDVSEICKNHGGGGHKGAAGFRSDTLVV